MYKLLSVIFPVLIAAIEIPISKDIYEKFLGLTFDQTLAIGGLMLVVVTGISVYSANNNFKFFCTVFFTSLLGGICISLGVLAIFGKIPFISLAGEPFYLIIYLIKFSSIPSIGISVGLLTPRKPTLGRGLPK